MDEKELTHLWAYLHECHAALDLIVNHEERANLHGGGREVFCETLRDVDRFNQALINKYGSIQKAIAATVNRGT